MGILWLTLSALRVIPGIFLVIAATIGLQFLPESAPAFVPVLIQAVLILLWLNLLAGAVLSWALFTHQPWAKTAAIVIAGLNLWDLPFGVALGIYTLWVLLPRADEAIHAPSEPA